MINEINVVADQSQVIDGYQNISVEQVSGITNGYVKSIICNCLDNLSFDDRNTLFIELLNKLSINGILTIRFMNLSLLPNKIISGDITGQKFSDILSNINSCWSQNDFSQLVLQSKGYSLAKLFNEHVHTVAAIQKTS